MFIFSYYTGVSSLPSSLEQNHAGNNMTGTLFVAVPEIVNIRSQGLSECYLVKQNPAQASFSQFLQDSDMPTLPACVYHKQGKSR